MIKNSVLFLQSLTSFSDTTANVKINTSLLHDVMKKDKKDKDAKVGGPTITTHAKWLTDHQSGISKRQKEFAEKLEKAMRLIAEMKAILPLILEDCEKYFREITSLKAQLEQHNYHNMGGSYLKPAGSLTGNYFKSLETYIKDVRTHKAAVLKEVAG